MTTSVLKALSPNLFVENESILFDRRRAAEYIDNIPFLGAVTFVAANSDTSETLEKRAIACGNMAVSLVMSALGDDFRLWLFVSDGPWRQATRITRHHKLWKSHRDLIESDVVLKTGEEVEIESEGLIRYAGLLEVSRHSSAKAINAVRINPSFSMIFSKRFNIDSVESVRSIFSAAFPKKDGIQQVRTDWLTLALSLCTQGDILLRVSGIFDDSEAAVDIIATEDIITRL